MKKRVVKKVMKSAKKVAKVAKKAVKAVKKVVKKAPKVAKKGHAKVEKVMHEYKMGELHSGSKHGPLVKNPKQAIAIALSEARKMKKVRAKKKK